VSAATQFRLNTDLGFTTVIAFSRAPLNETPVLSAKFAKIGGGGQFFANCRGYRLPITSHLHFICDTSHLLVTHIANVVGTNNME
jgi:hypothetical protein